jgi:hypothetical protein
MRKLPFLLLATALVGCARVPVVKPAPVCKPAPRLMQECKAPVLLAEGLTYSELLQKYLEDRQQFVLCAKQQKELRDTVQTCGDLVDDYNRKLADIQAGKQTE